MCDDAVLIVAGSRRWADYSRLAAVLDGLVPAAVRPAAVWHGGCAGADDLAGRWAVRRGLPVRVWPADWRRYGRSAGPRRSAAMIAAAPAGSVLAAFAVGPLEGCAGTCHGVCFARRRGLAVWLVDEAAPAGRWLGPPAARPPVDPTRPPPDLFGALGVAICVAGAVLVSVCNCRCF